MNPQNLKFEAMFDDDEPVNPEPIEDPQPVNPPPIKERPTKP